MAPLLDIPEVRQRLSRLSVEEYHRLGEFNDHGRRTELVRGLVIEKMSKSPLHRLIASRLYQLLLAQLPKGYCVWKEEPLTLADSEPEPDISVTRGKESDFTAAHPATAELVIEIAVSSAVLDRESASLYAEAGVKEYLDRAWSRVPGRGVSAAPERPLSAITALPRGRDTGMRQPPRVSPRRLRPIPVSGAEDTARRGHTFEAHVCPIARAFSRIIGRASSIISRTSA